MPLLLNLLRRGLKRAIRREYLEEQRREAEAEEARRNDPVQVARRLKLCRTKLYRDTRGWKDQEGNRIDDKTYAEIMELRRGNGG